MENKDAGVRQSELIYRRFKRLLAESDGRVRNVANFANMLHVTPKYLSKCVKEHLGVSPTEYRQRNLREG